MELLVCDNIAGQYNEWNMRPSCSVVVAIPLFTPGGTQMRMKNV